MNVKIEITEGQIIVKACTKKVSMPKTFIGTVEVVKEEIVVTPPTSITIN
jgi:hypothetical protein